MTINRRGMLTTLGKALGSAGLLLPLSRQGAVSLQADLGEAAKLPVKAAPLPISKEGMALREIRMAMHDLPWVPCSKSKNWNDGYSAGPEWDQLRDKGESLERAIAARPRPTLSDCVELAEILWAGLPKEELEVENVAGGVNHYRLDRIAFDSTIPHQDRYIRNQWASLGLWQRHVIAALVEAVLTIGNGERTDPHVFPRKFSRNYGPLPACYRDREREMST